MPERYTRIESASDGLLNDCSALFLQQANQSLFRINVAADVAIGVVEVANDGVLLGEGWERNLNRLETCMSKAVSGYTFGLDMELIGQVPALQGIMQIATNNLISSGAK